MDSRARHSRAAMVLALCLALPVLVLAQDEPSEMFSSQDNSPGALYDVAPAQILFAPHNGLDVNAASARVRRSPSIVFRPLFASQEREAERQDRQEAWRRYWESERRREAQAQANSRYYQG